MSRTISTLLGTLLGMTLLVAAAIPMAQGQDATPAAKQSANQSSSDKAPPVCFKLTGRCVEAGGASSTGSTTKAPGTAPTKGGVAPPTKSAPSQKAPLNLAAPDVRAVVPAEELQEPLPAGDQITEVQEDRTVAVKAEGVPPEVPLGFGAIWWALNHPSQAWRILTPAE